MSGGILQIAVLYGAPHCIFHTKRLKLLCRAVILEDEIVRCPTLLITILVKFLYAPGIAPETQIMDKSRVGSAIPLIVDVRFEDIGGIS